MKNRKILVLVIVIMIALIGILTACKPKTDDPGKDDNGITIQTFIDAAAAANNVNTSIIITSDGTQIYTYNNGVEKTYVDGLEVPKGNIVESTLATYSTADFEDVEISENSLNAQYDLVASIVSPKEFFGIEGDISGVNFEMSIDSSTKAFVSAYITYTVVVDTFSYETEITITAK